VGLGIAPMREQSDLDCAEAAGDEGLLRGTSHPHGDIGLAAISWMTFV